MEAKTPTSTVAPETLEELLEKIRELYRQEQVAKWGQGDQVNLVESSHLALRKGYRHARECLKQELPDLQTSTLYSYAFVAKHFDQEHTRKWGVSKLQRLIALQGKGPGLESLGDPAEIEVQVPQGDGSLVAKKFRDCTMRELQSAAKHRKQTRKSSGRRVGDAGNKADQARERPPPALWRGFALIGLGVVAGIIGDLLQPSTLGLVVSALGVLLFAGGVAQVIRHFASIRDRIIAAFSRGRGLKEQGLEVLRNGRKLFAILRSIERRPTATSSPPEGNPPSSSEKKAA